MKVQSNAAPKVASKAGSAEPPRSTSSTRIRSPEKFRGVFAETCARYEPLLIEAREQLRRVEVPEEIRGHYEFGVLEHDQPSFVLLPLMFLDLAEQSGGITAKHRAYLPWFMLSWELIAVIDDAIDRARRRSDRQTFVDRYGITELLPFSHYVMSVITEGIANSVPEATPWMARSLTQLCGLETAEVATRYAVPSEPTFVRLLRYHHEQARCVVAHAVDAALLLQGHKRLPGEFSYLMGDLMQDVDDVVNFVENRESVGENDDLRLGTVTYPLLATLRHAPGFAPVLDALWTPYRNACKTRRAALAEALRECDAATRREGRAVRIAVARHGIGPTIAKVEQDSATCIAKTPPEYRDYAAGLCEAFVARVRGVSVDELVSRELAQQAVE